MASIVSRGIGFEQLVILHENKRQHVNMNMPKLLDIFLIINLISNKKI